MSDFDQEKVLELFRQGNELLGRSRRTLGESMVAEGRWCPRHVVEWGRCACPIPAQVVTERERRIAARTAWEASGMPDRATVDPQSASFERGRILDAAERDQEPARDTWEPVNLGPYLRGEVKRLEPTVGLARSDGLRMFYPGKEHSVIGEMESGKSWFLLASAAAEMETGNLVVYIHFEECDPSDTVERLVALGAEDADILHLFRFVGPEQQVSADRLAALLDSSPTLVILDGVNEAMALHGWGIRDEDGAAEFRRYLVKPCTRAGAATVCADHVVKDMERRGGYALGSIHKGNALSGSLILLENAEPFGRGQRGRSHVYVTKDRPGHLRRNGRPTKTPRKTFMGELVVDALHSDLGRALELRFWAPKDEVPVAAETIADEATAEKARTNDEKVYAAVLQLLAEGKKINVSRVRAVARINNTVARDSLTRLVLAGRLGELSTPSTNEFFVPETYRPVTRSQDPGTTPPPNAP